MLATNSMEDKRERQTDDDDHHHIIKICDVNKDRLKLMHQKISNPPRLLTTSAAKPSCCIFRVPQSFKEINGKSYFPRIVSIGPFHYGHPQLSMIQEHKWKYLGNLLSRLQIKGLCLEDLIEAIKPLEMEARKCYSETIQLESPELVELMVLDGCFIIELFRKVSGIVRVESDDPIFTMQWIIPFFYRDLLVLENQIPFFVLECLFDLSRTPEQEDESTNSNLSVLALTFFDYALQRGDGVIAKLANLKGRHLLDLVRSSYIDFQETETLGDNDHTPTHIIQCVSKLRRAGIQLNQGKADSFLVVKYKHGVIEMPTITIDDAMSSVLLNCVAYEQCHNGSSKHFTTYATLLDCLVNTPRDVEYLCDHNIIENYLGTDLEVAKFINDLGKEVAFDIDKCYLAKLFNDVHHYYKNSWHVQWAGFKFTYFDTPWSFISALAAFILLVLTMAQTFYTIYGTYKGS